MTAAPTSWEEWRHQLSTKDSRDAAITSARISRICTTLGSTLAQWHVGTQDIERLDPILTTGDRLQTLRTDPFHRAAARELPAVATDLLDLADELEAREPAWSTVTSRRRTSSLPRRTDCGSSTRRSRTWAIPPSTRPSRRPTSCSRLGGGRSCSSGLNTGRRSFESAYRAGSDLIPVATWDRQTGAILAARVRGVSRADFLSAADAAWILPQAEKLISGRSSLNQVWETLLRELR